MTSTQRTITDQGAAVLALLPRYLADELRSLLDATAAWQAADQGSQEAYERGAVQNDCARALGIALMYALTDPPPRATS